MPELPEVETVKNDLRRHVLGKTIESVDVLYEKIIKDIDVETFKSALKGRTIEDVGRKGKYLLFFLTGAVLVSHLRMEGKYLIKKDGPPTKHEHVIFRFTDGTSLRYHDVRKFGTMNLFLTRNLEEIYRLPPLNKVGFDPFEKELTPESLYERFRRIEKPIKSTLLDQTVMSGLGNIYADEVCFLAKIHPGTATNKLSLEQVACLIEYSKQVLTKAIALGGTTIKSFSSHEISGRFQNELLVHTKEECPVCKGKILKIKIGGRSTYYCERCQTVLR